MAVLIISQGRILLIYRRKQGREYYVIPGGSVERQESLEKAALREAIEETSLRIKIDKKLWEYENQGRLEHYFLATNFSGHLKLSGPEAKRQSANNSYRLEWVELVHLPKINLLPTPIKIRILSGAFGLTEKRA